MKIVLTKVDQYVIYCTTDKSYYNKDKWEWVKNRAEATRFNKFDAGQETKSFDYSNYNFKLIKVKN